MSKIFVCVGIIFYAVTSAFSQVGINTVDPKAQLDIASSNSINPAITDGILIPRIENFPNISPSADQDGMLVYLKKEKADFPIGFYYWNSSLAAWTPLAGDDSPIFFREGTSFPSDGVLEGMYRYGNIGIGAESPEVKLKVVLSSETDHEIRTALEVDNVSSTPINVTYGILNNNRSITDSRKYGIKNNVSAAGKGIHYGIYNEVYQNSVEEMYGIYNKVGRTYGATKNHYGIYTEIGTPEGTGFAYGLYSTAFGNNPDRVYAGYFAGRLAIGATFENQYSFPLEKGEKDQILSLDDTGLLYWKYPNHSTYTSTGTSTGNFVIPEETYTLRINNGVSSITIPEAALCEGRILVLLAWNGISLKTFNFLGGDNLWDTTMGSQVGSITGGERLVIQSTGDGWVIISRQ